MGIEMGFGGFTAETVRFYEQLAQNNDKHWFAEHKENFEEHVLRPSKEFVLAMGARLAEISPEVVAVPKVDGSIFRIYRDVRFSADKSPFKTHLGIFFWEGTNKKMECPGYYFELQPANIWTGAGFYEFPDRLLKHYRDSVIHSVYGKDLSRILDNIIHNSPCKIGGRHYKKTPRGYDPAHPNAEYLLHKGLWAGVEEKIPDELYSNQIIQYCFERFKISFPLHRWLVEMAERAGN